MVAHHKESMENIKAVVFDLDDTLYDCTGSLVESSRRHAAEAMVRAGLPCSEEEAYQLQVELSEKYGPYYMVFDEIAGRYGADRQMVEVALEAYNSPQVGDISPFPDVVPTLKHLRADGFKLFLVTTGLHQRQQKKIDRLGIRGFFDDVVVNDQERGTLLSDCFLQILAKTGLRPYQVCCVGDRIREEIRVGNELGMRTIHILHGRFKNQAPGSPMERPNFTIKRVFQIPTILNLSAHGKGPEELRILAIGGGTGLPMVLEGAKMYTRNLAAVVTVTDSGRSSGRLRTEYGILPPGDIRNCLVALSETEQREKDMYELFQYRFSGGSLDGMSLGNLLMAAFADMTGSFEAAITKASALLAIQGKVLPSTLDDTHICAELEDGTVLEEEYNVRRVGKPPIKRVFLKPEDAEAYPEVLTEIERADIVVLGPGSLYTSVIANLLVNGITEAIAESRATKIYVCNVATQPGQSDAYTAANHVRAIMNYLQPAALDCVLVNDLIPRPDILERYRRDGADIAAIDDDLEKLGPEIRFAHLIEDIEKPRVLWEKQDYLRHDPDRLVDAIFRAYLGLPMFEW